MAADGLQDLPHLEERPEGLTLVGAGMELRGDFSRLGRRIEPQRLARELVVRAARLKGGSDGALVVDATAGLAEDSFLLAAYGFRVLLFERDATIAALLADALCRAAADSFLASAASRMELVESDSIAALGNLDQRPDVVYLDPMFPARSKSASVKKKLQLLQMLEAPCSDEAALLDAAFAAEPRKVVVKRPVKGTTLAGSTPAYTISGKVVRYDCYLPASS